MAASALTKHYKARSALLFTLHIILYAAPLAYFISQAYIIETAAAAKVMLSFSGIISIVLFVISLIVDTVHKARINRSIMWILLGGLSLCLTAIQDLILIMAAVALIDELIVAPLLRSSRAKLTINKEMDKRLPH